MRRLLATLGALSLMAASPGAAQQLLPIDATKLVPRRDSLVVMVGGQPGGASVSELRKSGDSLILHDLTSIGSAIRQETTVDLDQRGQVLRVLQTGKVREFQARIDIRYAGQHVIGQVQAVTPEGPKEFAVDTMLPPGTVDDNAIQALLPTLPWAEGASWTFPVFSAGSYSVTEMVLKVVGIETAMVPAGAFDAYRVNLSGGGTEVSFLILKKVPHTVLKVEPAGAPIMFELAPEAR